VLMGYLNVCMYENSVHVYKRALMIRVRARLRVCMRMREGGRDGGEEEYTNKFG